jgi:hypothetical protein
MPTSSLDPCYDISLDKSVVSLIRTKTEACLVVEMLDHDNQVSATTYKALPVGSDYYQTLYNVNISRAEIHSRERFVASLGLNGVAETSTINVQVETIQSVLSRLSTAREIPINKFQDKRQPFSRVWAEQLMRDLGYDSSPLTSEPLEIFRVDPDISLIRAADSGDLEAIRYALYRGADINNSLQDGLTPLMKASIKGHLEAVNLLLEMGADALHVFTGGISFWCRPKSFHTAADLAIENDHGLVAFYIIDHLSRENRLTDAWKYHYLFTAAKYEKQALFDKVLGVSEKATFTEGRAVALLIEADKCSNREMINHLISKLQAVGEFQQLQEFNAKNQSGCLII